MAYETKDNSGALFKNTRKETESHSDYRGEARIDGHDVWVSAWINKDKNGNNYMKLTFKRKDGTAERPTKTPAATSFPDPDSDIPF